MKTKRLFLLVLALCFAFSPAIAVHHKKQHHVKETGSEFISISLNKQGRSQEHIKNSISLLQSKHREMKEASFLQKERSYINLEDSNAIAVLRLENHFNTIYTGEVGIGDKSNTYKLVFDTGSVSIFVDSTLCSDAGCKNQHQYDHDDSPTYSAPSSPIEITVEFGSGTLEGKLARDTLYLGDIAAPNIEFYEVTNQRGIFNEGEFDGIFGLSKPFDSQYGTQKSAFDVMVERGIFAKNIFAFSLGRGSSSAYLTLGGYNQDELASEIQWFKVIHPSYWMIELDKVYLGDEDTKLCNNNCAAIIDSGTSLLTAPGTDLQVMTQLIGDVDCKQYHKMPNINFHMGKSSFSLTPDEYVITLKGDNLEFYEHSTAAEIEDCAGAFLPFDIVTGGRKVWILGDTFMSKHVVIFDRDNNRVGFAEPRL